MARCRHWVPTAMSEAADDGGNINLVTEGCQLVWLAEMPEMLRNSERWPVWVAEGDAAVWGALSER